MNKPRQTWLSRRELFRAAIGAGATAAGPIAVRGAPPARIPRAPRFALAAGTEILWDRWDVPHIFAPDAPSLFYGFGWAQARNHGDLLLRLYAQARGRGAEYFGAEDLESDRAVRTMNLVGHAERWYSEQPAAFRANLDAFAAGVNAYAEANGEALHTLAAAVLPVDGTDVMAHTARIFFLFMSGVSGASEALPGGMAGSNAWAVAPSHTRDGHALLLANPHLAWAGEQTFFEAHLQVPGLYDAYGATLVGLPVLAIAFNDRLGWTHTVNFIDPGDLYDLTLADGGYRYDGEVLPFETKDETIFIRQPDGTMETESLAVRRSVHGPVVDFEGAMVAIRLAAFAGNSSAAGALAQWWEMGRAGSLAEFETAVARLQVPMFTVIYADVEGHVLSLFNGQVPIRPTGDVDWSGLVPGDSSATLWTDVHPYADLPKVVDPPGGWVQNSNSPPWSTTYPSALDPADFPPYMSPQLLGLRERRGIRMLTENPRLSLARLVELKYSTRLELADRVLDELIGAARRSGDAAAARTAEVLAAWDREANPDSTGVVLFLFWVASLPTQDFFLLSDIFVTPADLGAPLTTPAGLADPEGAVRSLVTAAAQVEALFGRIDLAWGEVARLQLGEVDAPANGFMGDPFGVFRVLDVEFAGVSEGLPLPIVGGDSFVAAVEFGSPVRGLVLMTYGNSSQPDSPHTGDQLRLSAAGRLRPAWRSRAEIEANLEASERLACGGIGSVGTVKEMGEE